MPSTAMPSLILSSMPRMAGELVAQLPRPLAHGLGEQQLAAGGQFDGGDVTGQRPLIGDRERADLVDLVAEELDAVRVVGDRREDVEDAAAHRELAPARHHVDPVVRQFDQPGGDLREIVAALAHRQVRPPRRPRAPQRAAAERRGRMPSRPAAAPPSSSRCVRSTSRRRPTVSGLGLSRSWGRVSHAGKCMTSALGQQRLQRRTQRLRAPARRGDRRAAPRRRPAARRRSSSDASSGASRPSTSEKSASQKPMPRHPSTEGLPARGRARSRELSPDESTGAHRHRSAEAGRGHRARRMSAVTEPGDTAPAAQPAADDPRIPPRPPAPAAPSPAPPLAGQGYPMPPEYATLPYPAESSRRGVPPPPAPQPYGYAPPAGYARPTQGYGPYVPMPASPPLARRGPGLGIVAFVLAVLAAVGATIVGSIAGYNIGLGTGRSIALEPMDIDFDWSILTPVRDWVLLGEIAFWVGYGARNMGARAGHRRDREGPRTRLGDRRGHPGRPRADRLRRGGAGSSHCGLRLRSVGRRLSAFAAECQTRGAWCFCCASSRPSSDELLHGVRRIADEDRQGLALGGAERIEHPVRRILPPHRTPDAHPHAGELRLNRAPSRRRARRCGRRVRRRPSA